MPSASPRSRPASRPGMAAAPPPPPPRPPRRQTPQQRDVCEPQRPLLEELHCVDAQPVGHPLREVQRGARRRPARPEGGQGARKVGLNAPDGGSLLRPRPRAVPLGVPREFGEQDGLQQGAHRRHGATQGSLGHGRVGVPGQQAQSLEGRRQEPRPPGPPAELGQPAGGELPRAAQEGHHLFAHRRAGVGGHRRALREELGQQVRVRAGGLLQ